MKLSTLPHLVVFWAATVAADANEIEKALAATPIEHLESMNFLVANMPEHDRENLKAEFLLENVRLAHQAIDRAPWGKAIPQEIFLNNVLPYASINERRDDWRRDFIDRFADLIKDAKTPGEAAVLLNQKVFSLVNVRYSTGRRKANQSALESIESGTASCTGLAVLLIDACRALGVPARFVGTPLWSDGSGNHSWVEIWDEGWHFTGAAEPSGDNLDDAWFVARASMARHDDPRTAIYATSFQRTPQNFPMVWGPFDTSVYAVNVTERYTRLSETLPEGVVRVMFKVIDRRGGRVKAKITIADAAGDTVFDGYSNDDSFDANDHRTVKLKLDQAYTVRVMYGEAVLTQTCIPKSASELITLVTEPLE